jgi:hypothetical protein
MMLRRRRKKMCPFLWFVYEDADARRSRQIQMRRKKLGESACGFALVKQIFPDLKFRLDLALV